MSAIVLDADPVQARARKPEYPLDFLYFCRASYLTLNEIIGGMTIIPPMPVQDVEREVLQHALKLLPFAYTQNDSPRNSWAKRIATKPNSFSREPANGLLESIIDHYLVKNLSVAPEEFGLITSDQQIQSLLEKALLPVEYLPCSSTAEALCFSCCFTLPRKQS